MGSDGNIAAAVSEHANEWSRLEEIVDWELMLERIWKTRFESLIEGFEFPYGIELLSTVHYVAGHMRGG
jgi:hypothetical protein